MAGLKSAGGRRARRSAAPRGRCAAGQVHHEAAAALQRPGARPAQNPANLPAHPLPVGPRSPTRHGQSHRSCLPARANRHKLTNTARHTRLRPPRRTRPNAPRHEQRKGRAALGARAPTAPVRGVKDAVEHRQRHRGREGPHRSSQVRGRPADNSAPVGHVPGACSCPAPVHPACAL